MAKHKKSTILSMRSRGLSCGQIADKLDMPIRAVKSICCRDAERKKRRRKRYRPFP